MTGWIVLIALGPPVLWLSGTLMVGDVAHLTFKVE